MRVSVDGKDIEEFASEYNKKILLDTNVLVYAYDKKSQGHLKASAIMIACLKGPLNAYISNQNILEFYSVMTNPRKIKPTTKPEEIQDICTDLWQSTKLAKIFPSETAASEAIEIAKERNLRGPQVFDCLLAVTAKQNQIDMIWTENTSDFTQFEDYIHVENPFARDWKLVLETSDK